MFTYTVMADCGVGEFLWIKDESDDCLVGGNVYSLMDVDCITPDDNLIISFDLLNLFASWAKRYLLAQPKYWSKSPVLDWVDFNNEGMNLARLLKAELGNSANVQYVKAWNDPGRKDKHADLFLPAIDG